MSSQARPVVFMRTVREGHSRDILKNTSILNANYTRKYLFYSYKIMTF